MPREDTQFKTGNPGRPKGSRNKLSEDFLRAMAEDFAENGAEAIANTRINKPEAYLGAIVRLMPKLMELSGQVDHVTYDAALREILNGGKDTTETTRSH